MGVYVKGVEMPTNCRACHLKINCDDCEGLECVCLPLHMEIGYLGDLLTDKRRDDCPLVPAPLQWIPVTEQLPPAEKEVYVTDGEYIARANLLDEVFPGDKPCWSYSGLGEITHWCERIPLPQPSKEG